MDLDKIVNPDVVKNASRMSNDYATATPFEHIVIDNFLNEGFASRLLNQFPPFDRGNNLGDDGLRGNKSTFERIVTLGGDYKVLDDTIKAQTFLRLIGEITRIPDLLYDPFYLGGGTHENRAGQSLHAHIDFNYHPSEGWHRRLNLIVYLNHEWDQSWGGNLELYCDPYKDSKPAVRIAPLFNRCVIFGTTERSWHAFDRIQPPVELANLSRKSIALYFYTRERPAEQTAGKHTTHYVNRQIPDHIVSGYRLTRDDVDLLREIVLDRDDLLQRLYEENTSLRQAQDRGLSGKLIYLLKRFYVRYRK
jgi:2OG-Fe(II) oxygenase superfamily